MYAHRDEADMKGQQPIDQFGSKYGGIMSIFYFIFMFYYFTILSIDMISGENDIIKSLPMTNSFSDDFKKIDLL
jgi:hypothetical protein